MSPLVITGLMFASMFFLMAAGVPLAFALGAISVGFAFWLWGPTSISIIQYCTSSTMGSFILAAYPLFIFMGLILQESGIADDLFDTIYHWAGGLKGGLGIGTIFVCSIIAAMVGISGAATVSMGIIALPAMLKRGYDKRMATGLIMAGGALGILIPPSVSMILYAFLARVSVGRLFAAGIFPGLVLASMFAIYIGIRCYLQPNMGPPLPPEDRFTWKEKLVSLRGLILPVVLIVLVLGLIFLGITSTTEASAVGAFGALVCAALHRRLNWTLIKNAGLTTLKLCGMIFWIIIAALAFSKVYTALGAPVMIKSIVSDLEVNRWVVIIIMQVTFFILGMILDTGGILFICMPVYIPIAVSLGFDPTWFGILYIVNIEMAYLTPPYGFNLFYMRGVAPSDITMMDLYRSVFPFVGIQAIALVILMVFPRIATFLPRLIFGG